MKLTYKQQLAAIEKDMHGKYQRRDFHGVMDCAADLREREAFEAGRKLGLKQARQRKAAQDK